AEAAEDRKRIREEMARGFAEAAEDRKRIREEMARGFAEAAEDRKRIWEEIKTLKKDVRDLKGDAREVFYRQRAAGIFGRWVRRGADVTNEVADRLQEALDSGRISEEEYLHALASDLLWGGKLRTTGKPVVLVVEASWRVEAPDVERAQKRAAILRKAKLFALPVAAGRDWPDEALQLAQEMGVAIVQDGQMDVESWENTLKRVRQETEEPKDNGDEP
ncbi:MAG: hypothetical protein D6759_19725, partial [Chloroflexi bacterium]